MYSVLALQQTNKDKQTFHSRREILGIEWTSQKKSLLILAKYMP